MIKLFEKGFVGVVGVVGDKNSGKSNLFYSLISEMEEKFNFRLYYYGLKEKINSGIEINSIKELEEITNSVIFIDEFQNLIDLDDRKLKKEIERSLRTIHHNNNIMFFGGLPDNFKKFISNNIDIYLFKKIDIDALVNGSKTKNIVKNYQGDYRGSHYLNLPKNKVLIYDGKHYKLEDVNYIKKYDTKSKNVELFVPKNVEKVSQKMWKKCPKKCGKSVPKNVERKI